MTDTFNVTAAFDKASYNAGDTMKVTITGDDVLTQQVQTTQTETVTVSIVAADGATTTVGPVSAPVVTTTTTTTHESVKIASIGDASGRTWTVDPSGLFATAVA